MRLLQMTYFLMVSDSGSLTRAASLLYISQPALSKQISLLEQEIGTPLLKRSARGVTLTEAGIQFADDCRRILADINASVRKAAALGESGTHLFRIGCFDGAFIDDFMPPLHHHLQKEDPDIRIKLTRKTIAENRKALKAEEIDLMIEPHVFSPADHADISDPTDEKLLIHREGALIYSCRSPLAQKKDLTLADFAREPFLVSHDKNNRVMMEHALQTLHALGISSPRIEKTDNSLSVISGIHLGSGYALMTRNVAEANPDLLAFLLPPEYGLDIIAVWKRRNRMASSLMESYHPMVFQ